MKNSFNPEPSGSKRRIGRLKRWVARRRRTIAAHMLRGACYGIGTGAAGLGFWWIEWWAEHH
ncbi:MULTISPECIES: hypothetical protein [Streptomyces violaceusniger group]|uniref:Uncharacterized protein n=2 Tax=Streptomyces rhizosphaericus TaxID=114699 RepID=A0ABN1S7B4_9ACTN|nr:MULTISPECIES: hypothetical protein [Streptomyces violaceusniger group]